MKRCFLITLVFQAMLLIGTTANANLDLYEGGPTGQWWNPTRNGEGFFVEIINNGSSKQIGVAMYTYDAEGNPLWLVGNVAIEPGDEIKEIPVFRFDGPSWGSDYDPGDLNTISFGTITVRFPTCDTALFSIQSDGALESGDWSLQRITSVDGVGCVEPPPPEPPSGGPAITPGEWEGQGVCFMVSEDGKSIMGGEQSKCDAQAAFDSNLDGENSGAVDCRVSASCEGVWPINGRKFTCLNELGELVSGEFGSGTFASGFTFEGQGGVGDFCAAYWEAAPAD